MITVIGQGGGFSGLGQYLLHDIGSETTAERVAWTHAVNLGTDNARIAVGRMCATAMTQDALKEAAGVAKGGRKLKHPLAHIVLSWAPDERPSDEEMRAAGTEALAALKAEGLQALMVAHRDTGQPHLHIMLNRIDPETGVAAKLSNSQRALSTWALAYEKRQGQVRCEKRQANARKRRKGEDFRGEKRVPRHLYEMGKQFRLEATPGEQLAPFERHVRDQRRIDAGLKARSREIRQRHRAELDTLAAGHRAEKKGFSGSREAEYERREIAARQTFRAKLDALRLDHGEEWRHVREGERETHRQLSGIRQALRDTGGSRIGDGPNGRLTAAFNADVAGGMRRATITARQRRQRETAFQEFRAELRDASAALKEAHQTVKGEARQVFLADWDLLTARQDQESRELKEAWQRRPAERAAAYQAFRESVRLAKETRLEFRVAARPIIPQTAWRHAAAERQASPTGDPGATGGRGMERAIADERTGLADSGIVPQQHHAVPCDNPESRAPTYEGGKSYYQVTREAAQEVEAIRNRPSVTPGGQPDRYQTSWTISTAGGDPVTIYCPPEALAEDERRQGLAARKDSEYRAAGAQKASAETAGRKAASVAQQYLNNAGAQKAALKGALKATAAKPALVKGPRR